MKPNLTLTKDQIRNTTKIELFHTISEQYGSATVTQVAESRDLNKAGFKLDRLFSIVHNN